MHTITTTLTTQAVFSDDRSKRYLLTKTWDDQLLKLAIIMLAPSEASGIALDSTTQLVLNNASRLGYGSVAIVNLFAALNDFELKHAEDEDPDNMEAIMNAAQAADVVIYAPGVGKAKNKTFQSRQRQVLESLRPMEWKLHCLCNADGKARLQHPLSPAVRLWHPAPLKIEELLPNEPQPEPQMQPRRKVSKLPTVEPKA